MEQIYTIPVNEAFEASAANHECGCPFCALYNKLENDELDLILGASMMEPDVRIKTNHTGFCRTHYDMMFVRKNRLGMALTMESHLSELRGEIKGGGLLSRPGDKAISRIGELKSSCYVCERIDFNFSHMIETAVLLWESDESFREKLKAQPYFCLSHYHDLLCVARNRLGKKKFPEFEKACADIVNTYAETLEGDISWFFKKFDYRYESEPWYNSKDAVERTIKFLRSDLHKGK